MPSNPSDAGRAARKPSDTNSMSSRHGTTRPGMSQSHDVSPTLCKPPTCVPRPLTLDADMTACPPTGARRLDLWELPQLTKATLRPLILIWWLVRPVPSSHALWHHLNWLGARPCAPTSQNNVEEPTSICPNDRDAALAPVHMTRPRSGDASNTPNGVFVPFWARPRHIGSLSDDAQPSRMLPNSGFTSLQPRVLSACATTCPTTWTRHLDP